MRRHKLDRWTAVTGGYYRDFTIFAPIPEAGHPDWGFADNDGNGGVGKDGDDCARQIDAFYEALEQENELRFEPRGWQQKKQRKPRAAP